MTVNGIIKALECCRDNNCNECPIEGCTDNIFREALDLINRLQAKIENLKDILYDTEGVNLVNYWHQQCKIAENGCRNFDEENKNLKAEIERLQNIKVETDDFCRRLCRMRMLNGKAIASFEDLQNYIKKEKTEARQEFAERLKKSDEFWDCIRAIGNVDKIDCLVNIIDNLIKEMEEEKR